MVLLNSCIAILEFILRIHLIGWHETAYNDGNVVIYDKFSSFRSVALFGSPLSNALITTILNAFILFSNIKEKRKYIIFFIGCIAVLCFNARTAFFMNAFVLFMYILKNYKTYNWAYKIGIIFGLSVIVIGFIILITYTNLGSRIIDTSEGDSSIMTRLILFEGFMSLNLNDYLLGSTMDDVRYFMDDIRVAVIENFWIAYILHFGVIAVILFTYLYIKLAKQLLLSYPMFDKIVISSSFIILASTNNSLYSSYIPLFTFLLCAFVFRPYQLNDRLNRR